MLLMHAKILEGIKAEYSRLVWRSRGEVAGVGLLSCGVAGGMFVGGMPQVAGGVAGAGMLMATGLWVYNGKSILAEEKRLLEDQGLVDIFRRTHVRELHERDEYVVSVWGRIKEGLQGNLKAVGLGWVKEGDVKML